MAETCEAGRDGSWLAQNEPSALETLTTTGFADLRRSGSAASVTRMMPTALVSKHPQRIRPVEREHPDASVVDQDVEPIVGLDLGKGSGD